MFVPLRVHSTFSRGRGGATLEELAAWAAERRTGAMALSDVDNIYGWAKWKRAAAAAGFAPLFGCEVEVEGRPFLFLVRAAAGYANLMEILNRRRIREAGVLEGLVTILLPSLPPHPPRVEDGVVARTIKAPSLPTETAAARAIKASSSSSADEWTNGEEGGGTAFRALVERLKSGAGEGGLYIGVDGARFGRARELARTNGLPLVWANPLKFVRSPERLVLLRAFEQKIPYPPEWARLGRSLGRFGPDQEALALRKLGPEAAEAFRASRDVAGLCAFDFTRVVPPLPSDLFPVGLREEVLARLRTRRDLGWGERERALRELAVIERSGFGPYFLIVHDVVSFARRNGILHNLKGSGASSFLAWLLGLSHVNPAAFDLYFERFLNAGRDDPPDIDLDFDSRFRDRILDYVLRTYGAGRTGAAFVCSLKCYGARSALYETARAFGLPPDESRALSRKAPYFAEPSHLRQGPPPPGYLEVWNLASDLTGVHSEVSLHVGGVILTPAPADRSLPLAVSAKGLAMSHFDRDAVEDLKLIKLDLLSVRGLAAISATRVGLDLPTIPDGDPAAFALLKEARTIGCFQVESPAMMNLLRRMKPADIRDLVQALALIRPGPTESGMKETLLRSREGRGGTPDPFLGRILPETGGLLLYEEQVMQVAERVAGFPPEEGDGLRRALKRKGTPALEGWRTRFLGQGRARGYAAADLDKLWAGLETFSSYSFNKAHSASYAAMAYQAVYLKARHPAPYMTAVLNAGGGYYGLAEYVEEAKRLGLRILGPDINRSGFEFQVEEGAIRVGFLSIKGLGRKTAERIVEARAESGPYRSLEDALARLGLSKAELFSLVKAGVFDSLEARRTRQVLRYVQGIEGVEPDSDLDAREKAKMLLESLGFSPDSDPLALYEGKRPDLRIKDLGRHVGRTIDLVVRVVDARGKDVRGGKKYFYFFEDETGTLEGVGDRPCQAAGQPPVCCLRGEARADGTGQVKIYECAFLKSF
ncbi:MAG: PHP domain-containing protein [Candidatus Aminicenantes bacterium]|nr:PHP domain-containing protein [Candidatus Aminicenantes bacterium]